MPGDTLYMRDARVFVNGVEQTQGYGAGSRPDDPNAPNATDPLFEWQKRITVHGSRFGPAPDPPTHDNWGPLLIPPRHYFMMGDNRYASKDSRYWGVVPRENFRGRPMFVYYSWNADDSDRPLPFITDIRWGRLFHRIR
jgi:signal peptidase I